MLFLVLMQMATTQCMPMGTMVQCQTYTQPLVPAPSTSVDYMTRLGPLPDPGKSACLVRARQYLTAGDVERARLQIATC